MIGAGIDRAYPETAIATASSAVRLRPWAQASLSGGPCAGPPGDRREGQRFELVGHGPAVAGALPAQDRLPVFGLGLVVGAGPAQGVGELAPGRHREAHVAGQRIPLGRLPEPALRFDVPTGPTRDPPAHLKAAGDRRGIAAPLGGRKRTLQPGLCGVRVSLGIDHREAGQDRGQAERVVEIGGQLERFHAPGPESVGVPSSASHDLGLHAQDECIGDRCPVARGAGDRDGVISNCADGAPAGVAGHVECRDHDPRPDQRPLGLGHG